jgi:hypothetical protein
LVRFLFSSLTLFFSVRQPLQYQPPEGIFGRDTACVTLPISIDARPDTRLIGLCERTGAIG